MSKKGEAAARYAYAMQFILQNDSGEPEPYEVRRTADAPLSREDLVAWARSTRTEVVDRRSDVRNILATRIVVIRGKVVQGSIEVV